MPLTISGKLITPIGLPAANAEIRFRAVAATDNDSGEVIPNAESISRCGSDGTYSITLEYCRYELATKISTLDFMVHGRVTIDKDTVASDLEDLIAMITMDTALSDSLIAEFERLKAEAEQAVVDAEHQVDLASDEVDKAKQQVQLATDQVDLAKAEVVNASNQADRAKDEADRASQITGLDTVEEAVDMALSEFAGVMTTSERAAILAQNEESFVASGKVHSGKHSQGSVYFPVNEGITTCTTVSSWSNRFLLGRNPSGSQVVGLSKVAQAVMNIAGVVSNTGYINSTLPEAWINLPPAPAGFDIADSEGNARGTGKVGLNLLYEIDPKYGNVADSQNEAVARAFEGQVKNGDFRLGDVEWLLGASDRGTYTIADGKLTMINSVRSPNTTATLNVVSANPSYTIGVKYNVVIVIDELTAGAKVRFGIGTAIDSSGVGGLLIDKVGTHEFSLTCSDAAARNIYTYLTGLSESDTKAVISAILVTKASEEVVTDRVDMFGFEQTDMVAKDGEVFDTFQSQSTTFGDSGVPTVVSVRPYSFFAVYDGQQDIQKGRCVRWPDLNRAQKRHVAKYMKERLWVNEDGDLTFTAIRQRSFAGAGNGDWRAVNSGARDYLSFASGAYPKPQGSADVPLGGSGMGDASNGLFSGELGGWGSEFASHDRGIYTAVDSYADPNGIPSIAYKGRCFFYVLGTVSRLNQGAFAKGVNEAGGMAFSDGKKWFETTDSYATQLDCLLNAHATLPGRSDGRLPQYIYADGLGGVVDYRLSAYAMSSPEEGSKIIAKDDYRGLELVGEVSVSGNFEYQYTETIGGVITLPRECLSSTVECVHSSDGGVNWTKTNPNVNLINNTVTLPVGGESIVSFAAFAKQTKPSTIKNVLNATSGLLGIVTTQNHNKSTFAEAVADVILKSDASGITTEQSRAVKFLVDDAVSRIKTLTTDMVAPDNNSQAVKVAVYQISDNGQCKLGFIANTMSHNGTSWGELEEIQIPSGESGTFTDSNGVTQTAMITESAIAYGWTHNHARAGIQVSGVDL